MLKNNSSNKNKNSKRRQYNKRGCNQQLFPINQMYRLAFRMVENIEKCQSQFLKVQVEGFASSSLKPKYQYVQFNISIFERLNIFSCLISIEKGTTNNQISKHFDYVHR